MNQIVIVTLLVSVLSAASLSGQTRIEDEPVFDESGVHSDYAWTPSITGIRDLFLERAETHDPDIPADIPAVIDEVFGVSRFGSGFEITNTTAVSDNIQRIDFSFGDGGQGQALVGTPAEPNGILLVALHGCGLTPDYLLSDTPSHAHSFGLRALERGYRIVAPYVVSQCAWIHNLDYLGALSGVSVFGYELVKIRELTRWAQRRFESEGTAIWGISLGGQYAMLSSALEPDLFDVTAISGALTNYEENYLKGFHGVRLNAATLIPVNTPAVLSSRVARKDVAASILPKPIVFEISSSDATPEALEFAGHVEGVARTTDAPIPEVIRFEGQHDSNPALTLDAIDRAFSSLSRDH